MVTFLKNVLKNVVIIIPEVIPVIIIIPIIHLVINKIVSLIFLFILTSYIILQERKEKSIMAKRQKMSKKANKQAFIGAGVLTNKINVRPPMMRGGYRF